MVTMPRHPVSKGVTSRIQQTLPLAQHAVHCLSATSTSAAANSPNVLLLCEAVKEDEAENVPP